MADPFAAVTHKCGEITASQEDLLRDDPFINGSQRSSDAICLSSPSDDPIWPPLAADAPILICSVPDSLSLPVSVTAPILGGDVLRLVQGKSPAEEQRCPPGVQSSGGYPSQFLPGGVPHGGAGENPESVSLMKNSRVSNSRTKGAAEDAGCGGSPEPSKPDHDQQGTRSKDEIEKYRYQSLEVLKDVISNPNPPSRAVPGSRKLPATIQNVPKERITRTSSAAAVGASSLPTAEAASSGEGPAFPANLLDVINGFSGKLNQRFADSDILEIAAMKGIVFPPPQLWRPEGYDAKKRRTTE